MARRERKESHRIVEDCMLAANEAVAAYFQEQGLPSVYRFHGEPDPDKLAAFGELARAHGFTVPGKGEPTSRELNLFMRGLVGHPGQRALNQLLLRSMMQAVYSPDQVGHYGLGAEEYLHFTSPIRRYPDLLVHRLLRAHWERAKRRRPERELERELDELRRMAEHSSERERAAMKCEREVNALYACLLMEDRVGEEFAATVASVTDFGLFVELDVEHVEGLVRADDLGPGHRLVVGALVWPSGRRVQVGQALTVRLAGVNVQRRQMDFDVVAFAGERPSRRRGGAERIEPPRREHADTGQRSGRPQKQRGVERPGKDRPPGGRGDRGRSQADASRDGGRKQRDGRQGDKRRGGSRADDSRKQRGGGTPREPEARLDVEQVASSPHPGFDRLRALSDQERRVGKRPDGSREAAPRPRSSGQPGGTGRSGGGRFASKKKRRR
jgi:ribonuclease R